MESKFSRKIRLQENQIQITAKARSVPESLESEQTQEGYFTFGEDGTTKVYYPHPIIPASAVYTPEHQKYIRDNGDGTYDLTLNVTSTKESSEDTHTESVPADVMFLVDKSRSMVHRLYSDSEGEYKGSRAEVVNNALSAAINTLGGYKDIQLGGYKWSDNPSKFLGWYESTEQANAKLLQTGRR